MFGSCTSVYTHICQRSDCVAPDKNTHVCLPHTSQTPFIAAAQWRAKRLNYPLFKTNLKFNRRFSKTIFAGSQTS